MSFAAFVKSRGVDVVGSSRQPFLSSSDEIRVRKRNAQFWTANIGSIFTCSSDLVVAEGSKGEGQRKHRAPISDHLWSAKWQSMDFEIISLRTTSNMILSCSHSALVEKLSCSHPILITSTRETCP